MKRFLSFLMSALLILDPLFSLKFAHSELTDATSMSVNQSIKHSTELNNKKFALAPFRLGGDCGPKVLQRILYQWGKKVSLKKLIRETNTFLGQTNLLGMIQGVKTHGLWVLGIKTDSQGLEKLLKRGYSIVAHVGGNKHYVWVQEISNKWVKGYNPAVRNPDWKLPRKVFDSLWKGEGLIIWKAEVIDYQRSLLGRVNPLGFEGSVQLLSNVRMCQISGGVGCANCNGGGGSTPAGDGRNNNSGQWTAEPVELSNGNLFQVVEDINIPAVGPDLLLERTYNVQLFSDIEGWQPEAGRSKTGLMRAQATEAFL